MEEYINQEKHEKSQRIIANKGYGYGLVDFDDNIILPFIYDKIVLLGEIALTYRLVDDFVLVYSTSGKYLNQIKGDTIIFCNQDQRWKYYKYDEEDIAMVINSNSLSNECNRHIITSKGKIFTIDAHYSCILTSIRELKWYNVGASVIDFDSGVILEGYTGIDINSDRLIFVEKILYQDTNGNETARKQIDIFDTYTKNISTLNYEDISCFVDNKYAIVYKNKCGLINEDLELILPLEYEEINIQ